MKTQLRIWFLLLTWCIGPRCILAESTPNSSGRQFIVGLSPFLERSVKDDVYRRIVKFALTDLPLGSSLDFYDAYGLKTISHLEIPENKAFASAKTRANQFKEPIYKLKEFLARENSAGNTNKNDNLIRLPQFLDFIAANPRRSKSGLEIILLGNPLYIDFKEPAFSMADGYFPSDGHLDASREQTIYGLKERTGALPHARVFFGYFGDPWLTQLHEEKVARFWSLFLGGQGARLETFCADLPTVFNAALSPGKDARIAESSGRRNPTTSKIEMLRIQREVAATDWITRDILINPQLAPPGKKVGFMKIGIRWKGDIDLDLYATPKSGAETLFFQHPRSPEGFYNKDFRSSPEGEYEFIVFETPVNLDSVEARINYYEGRIASPTGEIRIEFDGKVYSGKFELSARHGNEGRTGSSQTEYWTRINIRQILKLGDEPETALR